MLTPVLAQLFNSTTVFIVVLILGLFGLVLVIVFARYIGLWIQCVMTNAGISFVDLIVMSIRKVNPSVIVRAKITAVQAGLTEVYPISTRDLQSHYLAGGNVPNVIRALVAAHRAKAARV